MISGRSGAVAPITVSRPFAIGCLDTPASVATLVAAPDEQVDGGATPSSTGMELVDPTPEAADRLGVGPRGCPNLMPGPFGFFYSPWSASLWRPCLMEGSLGETSLTHPLAGRHFWRDPHRVRPDGKVRTNIHLPTNPGVPMGQRSCSDSPLSATVRLLGEAFTGRARDRRPLFW